MTTLRHPRIERLILVARGLGVAGAYLAVIAILMYPVVQAVNPGI